MLGQNDRYPTEPPVVLCFPNINLKIWGIICPMLSKFKSLSELGLYDLLFNQKALKLNKHACKKLAFVNQIWSVCGNVEFWSLGVQWLPTSTSMYIAVLTNLNIDQKKDQYLRMTKLIIYGVFKLQFSIYKKWKIWLKLK